MCLKDVSKGQRIYIDYTRSVFYIVRLMKRSIFILGILFVAAASLAAIPDPDINVSWGTKPMAVGKGKEVPVSIRLDIPAGYYIYADKTDLEFLTLEGIKVEDVKYPERILKPDPLGGLPVVLYADGEIGVRLSVPPDLQDGIYDVSAILHYQACSDRLCLRPSEKYISWSFHVGDTSGVDEAPGSEVREGRLAELISLIRGKASETVLTIELKYLFIIAFIGGLLSSLTPCILPLIPVTLLIIGVSPKGRFRENFILSLLLVLGMSITYSALGLIAAGLGMGFGFIFQSRLFLVFVVAFFFLMGLSLMGIYTIRLPQGLTNALSRLGGAGYRGSFLAGISMGLLATPCVGPALGALLVYAGSSKSLGISFSLLMTYSIGLGLVIIAAGTFYGTFVGRLKKARVRWVKKFIGLVLLIPALYYLDALIPYSTLIFNRSEHPISWQPAGVFLGEPTDARPKMVLFTAEWCPPCKILKMLTLRDKDVVELSKKFMSIEVDATHQTPEVEVLVNQYDIKGWPTIIFVSEGGAEWRDLRTSGGYITRDGLLKDMKAALEMAGK